MTVQGGTPWWGFGGKAPDLRWASLVLLLVTGAAHAGDAAVEAPVRQLVAALNAGNVKAASATHIAAPTLIDEAAPYFWSGPKAVERWYADLDASEKASGIKDGVVAIGTPVRELVSGSQAYVVWPATYSYEKKTVPLRETAQWVFTLVKQESGWKIASWAWAAPDAVKVR
jgi:hypothetical protein